MPSGAGHDAQSFADVCPSGMIFIPSVEGRSHGPDEHSHWEDCVNGANLLLLAAGGRAGDPPLAGADPATTADPLPQALALTAIVITFGVSAFLLALAYRSWLQRHDDEVENDVEDRRIAALHHTGGEGHADAGTEDDDPSGREDVP